MGRTKLILITCALIICALVFASVHFNHSAPRAATHRAPGAIKHSDETVPRMPTLFCFIVARPGKEFDLVPLHAASLKQCTDYAVYSNVSHAFLDAELTTTRVIDGSMDVPVEQTIFGPIAKGNIQSLLPVWRHVTQFAAQYDWIAKIDADSVLLTERLHTTLAALPKRLAQTPVFITNPCTPGYVHPNGNGCVYGGLMIMSGPAVTELGKAISVPNLETLPDAKCGAITARALEKHDGVAEDGWLHMCTTKELGVSEVLVPGIIYGDEQACAKTFADSRADAMVAFHDFKTPSKWQQCMFKARRSWWLLSPTLVEVLYVSPAAFSALLVLAWAYMRICRYN